MTIRSLRLPGESASRRSHSFQLFLITSFRKPTSFMAFDNVRRVSGYARVSTARERDRESVRFGETIAILATAERAAGQGGEIEYDLGIDERVADEFMQSMDRADGERGSRPNT